MRQKLIATLFAVLTGLGLVLVSPGAAQAEHTYNATCSFGTKLGPTVYQNATKDGSYVTAQGQVVCHEGSSQATTQDITEVYIHISLQVRSAVTGLWHTRDDGSARWTGLIGNYPPTVVATVSDVCENTLARSHRIRYNDVWYRTGDGVIHQLSQGNYSNSVTVNCGN